MAHCLIKEGPWRRAKTMSQNSRNEYLEKMRERYQRHPGKAARGALLDEFCAVTGHEGMDPSNPGPRAA
jgi:hypothetical protein